MSNTNHSLIDDVKRAKADLHQLADEVKLKVHLARKDAADWWTALEPALTRAEHRLDDAVHKLGDAAAHGRVQAHLGLAELKSSWPGLEKAISHIVDDVKQSSVAAVDTARVKAHLAAMDADALTEKAEHELHKISSEVEQDTERAVAELRASFAKLRQKIGR